MRYRVRGPLHADTEHIATELRGFIAHTGAVRLSYLQMHGVAAHTIDISESGAGFFEETVLPKIGATGSFVEQRTPLRQPKELKLTATLCPTTATTLPNLSEWAGVWGEVVYSARRTMVRLRCVPEDAERLHELESQGWRVLRGPTGILAQFGKPAPFNPQFWPSRAGCAAAPAPSPASVSTGEEVVPVPAELAPVTPNGSSLTASEVLASADVPNLLLGVTPAGEGVRLAWRAMLVAVQDHGQRQEAVVQALLVRALSQGMGGLVIAERAKVTPRALAPLARRLRIVDMADPWESARIPWRALPPEGLKLLLGNTLPSPLPDTLTEALRAVGRRNLATPVLEALTSGEADDLAGVLEAGGGVVLLVEPGASASLLASLLILYLSLASLTRPLLICRPASLPIPSALADRAVQIVFGDAPTAAVQLQASATGWLAVLPGGVKIALQGNLAAPVEERAGADHQALVEVLAGGTSSELPVDLGWPDSLDEGDESAIGLAAAVELSAGEADELPVGLAWPDSLDEGDEVDEGAIKLPAGEADELEQVVAELPVGLSWPDSLEETGEPEAVVAELPADEAGELSAGLGWPGSLDEGDEGVIGLAAAAELPADEAAALEPVVAALPTDAQEAVVAELPTDEAGELPTGLDWPDSLEESNKGTIEPLAEVVQLIDEEVDDLPLSGTTHGFDTTTADDFSWEPLNLDADTWPATLLDDEQLSPHGSARRRRFSARRRQRLHFTLSTHKGSLLSAEELSARLAAAAELPADKAGELPAGLGWPDSLDEGDEGVIGLAAAAEPEPVVAELPTDEAGELSAGLDWPDSLAEASEPEPVVAELPADEAVEQPSGLNWPDSLEESDEGVIGLAAAVELPDDEAAELSADLGWPDSLEESDEGVIGLAAAAELEQVVAELPADQSDENAIGLAAAVEPMLRAEPQKIADLVAAWHEGASLTDLARELRQRRPGLSLLDAIQELKAAIQEGVVAPEPTLFAVKQATPDEGLVGVLRRLAVEEPEDPAAQDALSRWQAGGQRRLVVREVALAHGIKEPEARTIYDQVILPRVINDLNGSAAAVVNFLSKPGDQGETPSIVLDCISRLLGTRNANAGAVRPLLPMLRETLEALDKAGRA